MVGTHFYINYDTCIWIAQWWISCVLMFLLSSGHRSSIQPHCEDCVSVRGPSLSRSESRNADAQGLGGIGQIGGEVVPRSQGSNFWHHECLHHQKPWWLDHSTGRMGRTSLITHFTRKTTLLLSLPFHMLCVPWLSCYTHKTGEETLPLA